MKRPFLIILAGLIIIAAIIFPTLFKKKTENNQTDGELRKKEKIMAESTIEPTQTKQVPLPQAEDAVRAYFNLINEGKISDAVNMMAPAAISDDSSKQAWGLQLAAFKKLAVKKIEPAGENNFKVTMDVEMKLESAGGPIPFYGYENGENIRWVAVEKVGNIWKITGFATGP